MLHKLGTDNKDSTDIVSSTDEEERWREKPRKPEDLPREYWSLQELIKFIKFGDTLVTNLCLCGIRDYDLTLQINQKAIFDVGGLEVLINLIRSEDLVCCIGTLYVLKDLSINIDMRRYIVDMNAIEMLVKTLETPAIDITTLAIDVVRNLARIRRGRKHIRNVGAIPKIVALMESKDDILQKPLEQMSVHEIENLQLIISASHCIASIVISVRNLQAAMKCGLIQNIRHLLKTKHHSELIYAVLSICKLCSGNSAFQLAIATELLILDVVNKMRLDEARILTEACGIIFNCGKDAKIASLIRKSNGIEAIFDILSNDAYYSDNALMLAASGAAYVCSTHEKSVNKITELQKISLLKKLMMNDWNDDILTNICGSLALLIKEDANMKAFISNDAFERAIQLLDFVYDPLSIAATNILRECLKDSKYAEKMNQMNAVRILWSLLKNDNTQVQMSAAQALSEYIKNDRDSAEMVRSLVNGLALVTHLLSSNDEATLSAACALITEIAKNDYNLAILMDYRVLPMLAKLVTTTNEDLQITLGAAIASCTPYKDNAKIFGELRIIQSITKFMTSENINVRRSAAMALEQLSKDTNNCVTIQLNGVVPFLLEGIQSSDEVLRDASANCLFNIRTLALKAEELRFQKM